VSWHPNDLLLDSDLQAYEASVLTQFGRSNWQTLRTKALEDWLFPILKGRGFDPHKFRTRYEPDQVFGYTASAYVDHTSAAKSATTEDINLATIFATAGSDALYIGSKAPFCGVFARLHDAVSAVSGTLTATYWNGNWEGLTLIDNTIQQSGKPFSAGGSMTWTLPIDWAVRAVSTSDRLYWVKLTVSATPTAAVASQLGTIRASALRAPLTFRTLQLLFQEAPTGGDGPWSDKAQFYREEADAALQRALAIIGGEFDTDDSDLISEEEAGQTVDEASSGSGGFLLERR
jgi:hypothetical protein